MVSLSDVPIELLEPFARKPFMDWVALQQIDHSAKRRLIKIYTDLLETTFTREERVYMNAPDAE